MQFGDQRNWPVITELILFNLQTIRFNSGNNVCRVYLNFEKLLIRVNLKLNLYNGDKKKSPPQRGKKIKNCYPVRNALKNASQNFDFSVKFYIILDWNRRMMPQGSENLKRVNVSAIFSQKRSWKGARDLPRE